MKVFLKQDIPRIGMAGEIIKVEDGYARNYLLPRKLAIEITNDNELLYAKLKRQIEHRQEVIATQTSMMAERIKGTKITIKRKMHDDGKLYGSISQLEVVEQLALQGISVSKNQVIFDKSIKSQGLYEVTIKLTSRLQPVIKVAIVAEKNISE